MQRYKGFFFLHHVCIIFWLGYPLLATELFTCAFPFFIILAHKYRLVRNRKKCPKRWNQPNKNKV